MGMTFALAERLLLSRNNEMIGIISVNLAVVKTVTGACGVRKMFFLTHPQMFAGINAL